MINWTEIILAIIGLVGAVLTGFLIPWIRTKTSIEQRQKIQSIVNIGVWAAEQVLKLEDPTGAKRKQYVLDYVTGKGIKIDLADLDVMIEAAVKELNLLQAEFVK